MAIKTVVPSADAPSFCDFANDLAWDMNELSFRAKAALEVLHGDDDIDTDCDTGLALSYLLQGIAKRAEELAVRTADSSIDYVLKPNAQPRGVAA